MKLTIFSRLIIGYLVIFLLAMAVSIYAIAQLRQLENVTNTILAVDNRLVDFEKKLSDILLSMMRYERKFIIMNDKILYEQFHMGMNEFSHYMNRIASEIGYPEIQTVLDRIREQFKKYHALFDKEAGFVMSGEKYPVNKYRTEKENAVNEITKGLLQLRSHGQQNTYEKVKKLGEAEVKASKVAIAIGMTALTFGVIVSIAITVNITRPLSAIKKQTRKISAGDFENDLELSSPPEIAELAQAFNLMCEKLKELDRMKSEFFSLMSHELRTPLTTVKEGINLFLEDTLRGVSVERQKKLLNIISEEINRLINLVNSLMELSKMEAGMTVYNFSEADIVPLIHRVTLEMDPLVRTKGIKMETETRTDMPRIRIDSERIMQVLRNLVGNAVKFTPENGTVKIAAEVMEKEVRVSVSDTGEGISGDKLFAIFDKFQSAGSSSSSRIKGSGLGLYIVKQIINAHGGKVWAESTKGHGSTFAFVLPV